MRTWSFGALAAMLVAGCSGSNGGPSETPATRGDRTVPHTTDSQGPSSNNAPPIVGEKTHLKGGLGGKR